MVGGGGVAPAPAIAEVIVTPRAERVKGRCTGSLKMQGESWRDTATARPGAKAGPGPGKAYPDFLPADPLGVGAAQQKARGQGCPGTEPVGAWTDGEGKEVTGDRITVHHHVPFRR